MCRAAGRSDERTDKVLCDQREVTFREKGSEKGEQWEEDGSGPEASAYAFTGRESDLDMMSRRITELSTRVVYLIGRDPDDCSPSELAIDISEVESMWAQVWGVLQRIYTIEDLILISPDPELLQIKAMSLLVYTNRGLAKFSDTVPR